MKFFKIPIRLFRNEKGTGAEIASGTCFWDRYWACAGVRVPEVFANPGIPISFSFVKANCFFSPFLCFLCQGAHPTQAQVVTKKCASLLKFNVFVSVQGLGFLMLHLGVDASSPLSFGGELLDGKYV